jgi:hypothetical protein
MMVKQTLFGTCILSDAYLLRESAAGALDGIDRERFKHTILYIDAPDQGHFYEGNGHAHIIMRDKDIQHEYRVREGNGGFEWFLSGLPDMIRFSAKQFHK